MIGGKRKGPPQDQRPPNQLESNNVVNEEAPPFCRACEDFHEESTCPIFCQINEQGLPPNKQLCRSAQKLSTTSIILVKLTFIYGLLASDARKDVSKQKSG
jgi:hypothetical protein